MESLMNRRLVTAVLAIACLTAVLLIVAPIRSSSPGPGEYDAWLDWNDDGKIDMIDISRAARAFMATGQNISKASLAYDSGWLDLRNETGEYYTIIHNLNESELQVDARQITSGWNRTYGGTGDDVAFALAQTSDSGYALAGYTESFGAGNSDAWLVKTDVSGNALWNRTYGGTDSLDVAFALAQTSDSGYALAGFTTSFGAGSLDVWLVKTDTSGDMQWNSTYGGTGEDETLALAQTNDGGYALAGYTTSFGAGSLDVWLVKTDTSGDMQWNSTYGGTKSDWASALVQTNDSGYALAGFTESFGAGKWDFWLVKTDASGTMQWNRTYGGTNDDIALTLAQTNDGGYALAGRTTSFGAGNADIWLVKTDASGTMQWNRTYGGTGEDETLALAQTSDSGYALAGRTTSFGAGNADIWLVKTDASGTMQWNRTYGGTNDDWASALVQTNDGEYTLAGYTTSLGAGSNDFCLVKADAFGNIGGVESGLAWVDSSANTITLYRGTTHAYWNYVRVRLWKPR